MNAPGSDLATAKALKVRLIIDAGNKGWIIGKLAERLASNVAAWNVSAEISDHPSAEVDINHWMFYGHAWGYFFQEARKKLTKSTVSITHIDDPIKVRMLREVLDEVADIGVCMSKMTTENLAARGLDKQRLCYITPGHDGAIAPRRTVIGITSRAYPDGRKRERMLVDLAHSVSLTSFQFEIVGSGWDEVVDALKGAGATVNYFPGSDDFAGDYQLALERLRICDYYLYLGMDEGSMGLLDALAMGVETIVTRQGFHLDIEGAITHGFVDLAELSEIFRTLGRRRERLAGTVKSLTWREYARKHAILWGLLVLDQCGTISEALHPDSSPRMVTAPATDLSSLAKAWKSDFRSIYLNRRVWEIRSGLSRLKRLIIRS